MTGVYLYCIAPDGREPRPELRGLDDQPVAAIGVGRFTVWVSPLGGPPAPSVDRARRHNAVVMAAATEGVTPVPVRFGQWFASVDALETRVLERGGEYEELLGVVAGALELGAHVLDPAPAPARAGADRRAASGREYLAGLARRAAADRVAAVRGERVAAELRAALGGLVRRDRVDAPGTAGCIASIAHLVGRSEVAAYRARMEAFGAGRPDLRLVVSGPWPPYSFVS